MMSIELLERWWMMFLDDPCDDVCENVHQWTKLLKKD
jgi:hypothetical protein